ncbi:Rha family transcriptional regulator, partial [Clostridium cadaveris]|uniref:Rha family transcriptional regulator n=1 Tax=Clostridium cadaveris TaxID=1529 RepID=UPI0031E2C0DD
MKELISIKTHEGEMVVTSREVAENFEKRHADVIEKIEEFIKTENSVMTKMFIESSYKAGTGKSYKEYLLTRDGFTLLAMGFTGSKAIEWKLKYIDAFNKMEQALKEQSKPTCIEDLIIMQAQSLKDMREQVNQANYHALEAKAEAEKSREEIQAMRDVVATNSNNWREDCRKLIVRIAQGLGGNGYIGDVQREIYELMRTRLKCKLDVQLTNMR